MSVPVPQYYMLHTHTVIMSTDATEFCGRMPLLQYMTYSTESVKVPA